MFKLEINRMANAAFQDGYRNEEVSRILRDIADQVENGRTEGRPMDINGNGVGEWSLTEDE